MFTLTIRAALAKQEEQLNWYCTPDKEYADEVRRSIIEATDIDDIDLDTPMPIALVNRHVPRGGDIEYAIFKWKLASYTYEVSEENFDYAFGSVLPARNHYPEQYLCGEELILHPSGSYYYYSHYYTKQVDGETKWFTKPATLGEYDQLISYQKES